CAAVVDAARGRQHRVPATAGLPVAVHREREAVGGLHDPAFIGEATDALQRRTGDVDVVNHAAHDVEVVARDAVVDDGAVRLVGVEVQGGVFEKFTQLLPRDAHGTQRVFIRVDAGDVALMYFA